MKHLILGGARSGKSQFAERCATASHTHLTYMATGEARDAEMAERISHHQQSRGDQWSLIEEPVYLARALRHADGANRAIVVDCLTLWLSNCLEHQCFASEKALLLQCLPKLRASLFFVSNEVGSGVVPLGPLSREFVDQAGWLHQSLAKLCEQVTLVVAGQALPLKPNPYSAAAL